jgi:hypothetical protein
MKPHHLILPVLLTSQLLRASSVANPPTAAELTRNYQNHANVPEAWVNFVKSKADGKSPLLPDYSYAGYNFGVEDYPEPKGPIFDVTKYGASPKGDVEARSAIQAAIDAAEKIGGGIIFFPPGKYLVNEEADRREAIVIHSPNIFIKGSGSGPGGTELFMAQHLEPTDPTKKWTTPAMFTFSPAKVAPPQINAKVVQDASRESFSVVVDNEGNIKQGDMLKLEMKNVEARNDLLAGLKPWSTWKLMVDPSKPELVTELHEVKSVEGNKVTFTASIHMDIAAKYGWKLLSTVCVTGWGVEDIFFRGNFTEKFVHHKNAIHDGGWTFLHIQSGKNAIVRRIRLNDVNECVGLHDCYLSSMQFVRVEGNPAHSIGGAVGGYGNLLAFIHDASDGGFWHGPDASHHAVGTVVMNYLGLERSGPDFHANYPYCSLIDDSSSGLVGNGGNVDNLPNHGLYLTWWNFNQIGKSHAKYDFFDEEGPIPYTTCKIVKPYLIGFHGAKTTFQESHLGRIEFLGQEVWPKSLYEAQITLREGIEPQWIARAKKAWEAYLKSGIFVSPQCLLLVSTAGAIQPQIPTSPALPYCYSKH